MPERHPAMWTREEAMSVVLSLLLMRHSVDEGSTFGDKVAVALYEGACLAHAFGATQAEFVNAATKGLPKVRKQMMRDLSTHAWTRAAEAVAEASGA